MRPVRAALIARCFIVALAGRLAVFVRLPRAMPWAMETLGFQPVFAQTLLVLVIANVIYSRYCKRYLFSLLQTLLFSRPGKRYCFHVLANP